MVAKPDEKWGETPCAFVELKGSEMVSAEELIGWCRQSLAGFKVPKHVVFTNCPDLDRQGAEIVLRRWRRRCETG